MTKELPAGLEILRQEHVLPPTPRARGVQKWRDAEGIVFGFGWVAGGRHWIHLLGVGTYFFVAGAEQVTAVAEPSVDEARIVDGFERTVLPMALHVSGRQVLHASAVLLPAGVAGFCAYGGTGKSTLAYGLGQRGHPLIADDALAYTMGKRSVEVLSLPFAPRLVQASVERLGRREASEDVDGQPRLAALAVLARDRRLRRGPRLRRLAPSRAFAALLPHAYRFSSRDLERKRAMLTTYLELVEQVPVLSVRFQPDLDRIPQLLDEIEGAVGLP